MRQVAAECGVSYVTVSNVLRGVGRTSEATRQRVLKAAQDLNYLPVNPPTFQNRIIETRVVTLVPEHEDLESYELDLFTYQGIVRGARQHGYDVLTMVSQSRSKEAEDEKARYLDRRSDGFIFAVTNHGYWEGALSLVAEHGIPTVVCYSHHVPSGVASVDADNTGAMQQAVEHLVQNGHRRIAYLAGPPDNFNEMLRRRAWVEEMKQRGLPLSDKVIVPGADIGYQTRPQDLARVKDLGVTAVVCFNDTLALALWDMLEAQGLSVPRDISLIGMDNRPEAQERGLSSLAFTFADIGFLAMEAWIELKCGRDAALCSKIAPVKLEERASVRYLNPKFEINTGTTLLTPVSL